MLPRSYLDIAYLLQCIEVAEREERGLSMGS